MILEKNFRSFLQKLDPNLTFDLLPGDVFRALIELGFCAYPVEENICYDLVQLVIGMDSKDIDEVLTLTNVFN